MLRTQAKTARDVQRIQCVLYRVTERYTAAKTARLVGYSEVTVKRVWSQYLRDGQAALLGEKRGRVRGAAHLPAEEERAFLLPFLEKARSGTLTTIHDVHAAHCRRVGKTLDPTVTYRLLDRHGWRKVVPRPAHPKADKAGQETFKVFFPPNRGPGQGTRAPLWSPFPADVPR